MGALTNSLVTGTLIVAASVAMWLWMRRGKMPMPAAVPAGEFAAGETYRVRRGYRDAPAAARGVGVMQVLVGALVLTVGIAELLLLRGRMAVFSVSGVVIMGFGMYAAGLLPAWVHDCLASVDEIVYFDIRGEVRFGKGSSTARIEALNNRVYPFRATFTRHDGKTRKMVIDERGIAVLRALGWVNSPDSPCP